MSKTPELWLPNPELMSEADLVIHEHLSARSLDDYQEDMQGHERIVDIKMSTARTDQEIRLIDLRGDDEGSSKKAVVLPLPYGNAYSPAMHIRARALMAYMPEDTRLLVFPNNTKQEKYYELHDAGKLAVVSLADMIMRSCNRLGIEEAAIAGYSQGASVGAAMLRDGERYGVDVKGAYLGDPANVERRTEKELKKAFIGTGLGNLNRGINDSGIPALTEAQLSGGGIDAIRQLIMFAGVRGNAKIPENIALHQAMTGNDFLFSVNMAISDGLTPNNAVTIARMKNSKVCTRQLEDAVWGSHNIYNLETVEGYGHEGGDNVVDNALRVRAALVRAGFWQKVA